MKTSKSELLLTTEQLQEATDISEGGLKELLREKLLHPAHPSKGKRQRNGFSFTNAIQVKILQVLTDAGVKRSNIRPLSKRLAINDAEPIRNPACLEFLSDIPKEKRADYQVSLVLSSANTSFEIKMNGLHEEVKSKLEAMGLV